MEWLSRGRARFLSVIVVVLIWVQGAYFSLADQALSQSIASSLPRLALYASGHGLVIFLVIVGLLRLSRETFGDIGFTSQRLGLAVRVSGGSTLATQIEKYRHSRGGRTTSVGDKFRQVSSAALRAYLRGPDTLTARRQIVLGYLNTVPLASIRLDGNQRIRKAMTRWTPILGKDHQKPMSAWSERMSGLLSIKWPLASATLIEAASKPPRISR